jgi:hypothetical protein
MTGLRDFSSSILRNMDLDDSTRVLKSLSPISQFSRAPTDSIFTAVLYVSDSERGEVDRPAAELFDRTCALMWVIFSKLGSLMGEGAEVPLSDLAV